jgi:peroxiredoxin
VSVDGPAETRRSATVYAPRMMRTGEPLPAALRDATVVAPDGRRLPFGELLGGRPVLVLFLREFGCIACAEQVHEIAPRLAEIAALGVRVVLVGNGPHERAGAFLEHHALADKPVELVTDPTLAVYRAAGLQRSAWATHGPFALADFLRALGHGHRPGRVEGDLRQQGGACLLDEAGVVVWAHRSTSLGDHPDPADIVDAVLALRLRGSPLPV